MTGDNFDLIVLGSGPGGYVAAIRASQLGMKTAIIEREHLGGICLNWGCIPTKALLRASEIRHVLDHLDDFGFSAKDITFDLEKVIKRSRKVADQLSKGVRHLMKKNAIQVFEGHGRLAGDGRIEIEGQGGTESIGAPHIVLATGARAKSLPGLEPDGRLIWTYKEAMVPKQMPKRLLVIGSGAIGTEFASFYSDMGADVTLVEAADRILPAEDAEIADLAHKQFSKQGIDIRTNAKVSSLQAGSNRVDATVESGDESETLTVDRAILAIGITGNIEDIGLENTSVKTDRGHILADQWMQTDEAGVYAIGDVVGAPWLAHKASHEGVLCVEKIAGVGGVHPLRTDHVPGCTYCRPQIASVGQTEAQATEAGRAVKIGRFPLIGNGKAIALGEPEGLVKTVFDAESGELLGAHMIGPEVTELIQGYAIGKKLETTEAELMETIFPHPTLSESMHESVLDAYGRVIHI